MINSFVWLELALVIRLTTQIVWSRAAIGKAEMAPRNNSCILLTAAVILFFLSWGVFKDIEYSASISRENYLNEINFSFIKGVTPVS